MLLSYYCAISDIGFGEIARQARYKAILYGTRIIEADRWGPSSKMCSVCDFVHSGLKLSDRTWTCPNGGVTNDRDIDAARNLKRLATETALAVASSSAMKCTSDVAKTADGGKFTPVSYDVRPQEVSWQKGRAAVLIISYNHLLRTFSIAEEGTYDDRMGG